jgi:hypothetical protein
MDAVMINLYGTKMSSALRNPVLLKEIGLDYVEIPIDLAEGSFE